MVQRVLLAEDDETLRGQLIDLLTARQFVVESFGNGAAALDFGLNPIEKVDFNIYLTDPKQIEVYKAKQKFINDLNDYCKATQSEYKPTIIMQALPMQFQYNYSTNQLAPSI